MLHHHPHHFLRQPKTPPKTKQWPMLPAALQNANPLGLMRLVDGEQTRATVG